MYDFFAQINEFALPILIAVIIAIVGFIAVKLIVSFAGKILKKANVEITVKTFLISVIKVILYLILLVAILSQLGINVTSIVAAVGAAALTAGLALQSTLTNIASGIIILINKPFLVGDVLLFDGNEGTVESIKIFSTKIHTFDNKTVIIPNSRLTNNDVINCSTADKRRLDLKYQVGYEADIQKVKQVISQVIEKNENVFDDPAYEIYVGEHLDSGIQIIVRLWVEYKDYYSVYYYMQENVKIAFDENDISIPYPHLVLKNNS